MGAFQVRAFAVHQAVIPQLLALVEGPNLVLDKPIILIGRHQECDIQIPSRKISRRHCCIAQVADHLVIRDLGSTNGVRINGLKIVEGQIKPNDELTIGNMRYKLLWGEEAEHGPGENGIKAGHPGNGRAADPLVSVEEPMLLPEEALSHPVLQAQPNAPASPGIEPKVAPTPSRPPSIDVPEDVRLLPLEPPPVGG